MSFIHELFEAQFPHLNIGELCFSGISSVGSGVRSAGFESRFPLRLGASYFNVAEPQFFHLLNRQVTVIPKCDNESDVCNVPVEM